MSNLIFKVHDCAQLPSRICESRQYYDRIGMCRIDNDNNCFSQGSGTHDMMVIAIDKIHDLQKSIDRVDTKLDTLISKNFSGP